MVNLDDAETIEGKRQNYKLPVKIIVYKPETKEIKKEFKIDNVSTTVSSVQQKRCYIYVVKRFNYDPGKVKQEYGYRSEIWQYNYFGKGKNILTLKEIKKDGKYAGYFDLVFSVDWSEKYIVLEKTYTDPIDNRIVFKELKNLEKDVFELSYRNVITNNPGLAGYLGTGLVGWDKNSQYFWLSFFDDERGTGSVRINTYDWTYEIFVLPDNVKGGIINTDTGWFTHNPASYWSGDAEGTDFVREERKKQGKSSNLHIYNLFTKEDRLIESTKEDPIWFYKPEWISENELEYELPSGEKKIYNIETKEYKPISKN